MRQTLRLQKGFTLIELLIVVAIIAILAAIAVPNFLEAQTRSKISRVRADMRSLATAMEAYFSDHNEYPLPFAVGIPPNPPPISSGIALSTPVAYITNAQIPDPFGRQIAGDLNVWGRTIEIWTNNENDRDSCMQNQWDYVAGAYSGQRNCWILISPGPNRTDDTHIAEYPWCFSSVPGFIPTYDSTNGTVSHGDLFRTHTGRGVKGLLLPLTTWVPAGEDPYM
jgi:prepilin-type N-terminal cleavage/methylation domain-containing protein